MNCNLRFNHHTHWGSLRGIFMMMRGALKPQTLYKFHFHESTIFSTVPQTQIISNVILKNKKTRIIEPQQEDALQKSFESVVARNDDDVDVFCGSARSMNKLYAQVYHPFLNKSQLNQYFKDGKSDNIMDIKKFMMNHIRLKEPAVAVLEHMYQKPNFDFGILRSNYFPSLGIAKDYSKLLKSANATIFRNHTSRDFNYSQPLSTNNFERNGEIMTHYLKQSNQLHQGVTDLKNFLIIDNPNQSEFFISMASRLGTNVIVLTESKFASPSSTIDHLFRSYRVHKAQRELNKCHEIFTELVNMKLICMKSMKDLMKFLEILQDPYLRLHQLNNSPSGTTRLNSFDKRLLEMELSILGDIETKNIRVH